jgi:hypothetical protein
MGAKLTHVERAYIEKDWWAHLGSNQGPTGYEPVALPLSYRPRMKMAPRAGFEPATYRLTAGRSTVELPRNTIDDVSYSNA